ncbi:hypothetical protein KUTeg_001435 [Tegillarca granosa]|uniref:Uncharacterized protein n=1 Tax=Tegillarca granosa TaxID=220873 RepID=A0ABQ9FRF0_TEGGR|nr:hypothetical protein KUTeg_022020 [Tegillarca granosa]KAJ8300564.1 hypothetical protein KUTeg_022083 [Tegillarca granosa]KAJ8311517.1 hypothetical protein KUTeg_010872 [Tegillarca granosa]KAJ8319848.1 hypothetical protein KUTeg_001435 [Tegillarca granosa]
MAFWPHNVHKSEGIPKQLNLFTLPPVQSAVEKSYFVDCRPVSQISDGSPIEFNIANQGSDYIDLQRSRLYIKGKIVAGDGTTIDAAKEVGPINFLHQTLFDQIDVRYNGKLITSSDGNFGYKAYLQTLLNSSTEKIKSFQQMGLFYEETNVFDTDPVGGSNPGMSARFAVTKGSKVFEMTGPILQDCFQADRYLINNVDISVKLYRNRPIFYLKSTEAKPDFKFEILDIYFRVCKISLNPAVFIAQEKEIENIPALYPYRRTECRVANVNTGQTSFHWDAIFQNHLPLKVAIAFVNSSGYTGDWIKNPFRFEAAGVGEIALLVDGVSIPMAPMKLAYDSKQYVQAYANLFDGSGKWTDNSGLYITKEKFTDGHAIYLFTLETPFDEDSLSLMKNGNLRLEVNFSSALTTNYTCIAYAEFQQIIQIDKSRTITLN